MPQDLASPAMSTCRLYRNQHRGPHDFTWEMPFILLLYINIYFISTQQFPRITQQTKPHDHVRNTYKKQPAMNQRITNALYLQLYTSWQQLAQGECYCLDEQNLKLAPAFNDRKNAENLILYI